MGKEKQMAEFKVIESQDELNEIVANRVNKEKDKARAMEESLRGEIEALTKSNQEYQEKLQKFSEVENSHADEVAKLNSEIAGYRLQAIKHKIAHENERPYELAERLTGEDEDALRKDAETLKQFIGVKKTPPLATTEVTPEDQMTKDLKETLKQLQKGL